MKKLLSFIATCLFAIQVNSQITKIKINPCLDRNCLRYDSVASGMLQIDAEGDFKINFETDTVPFLFDKQYLVTLYGPHLAICDRIEIVGLSRRRNGEYLKRIIRKDKFTTGQAFETDFVKFQLNINKRSYSNFKIYIYWNPGGDPRVINCSVVNGGLITSITLSRSPNNRRPDGCIPVEPNETKYLTFHGTWDGKVRHGGYSTNVDIQCKQYRLAKVTSLYPNIFVAEFNMGNKCGDIDMVRDFVTATGFCDASARRIYNWIKFKVSPNLPNTGTRTNGRFCRAGDCCREFVNPPRLTFWTLNGGGELELGCRGAVRTDPVQANATAPINTEGLRIDAATSICLQNPGNNTLRYYFAAVEAGGPVTDFVDVPSGQGVTVTAARLGFSAGATFFTAQNLGDTGQTYRVIIGN